MTTVRGLIPFIPLAMGASVSGYLLYRALQLITGNAEFGVSVCTAYFGGDCDATLLRSPWWAGIPVAGWGVVYFVSLAFLLAMGHTLSEKFRGVALATTLAAGSVGIAISAWLTGQMLTGRAPGCPLCYVTHGLNLFFIASVLMQERARPSRIPSLFREAAHSLFGDREENASWHFVGLCCAGLVGLVVFQWILVEAVRTQTTADIAQERIASGDPEAVFVPGDPVSIPIIPTDPQIGPPNAPIQVVVFSSFQCGGCQVLSGILPALTSAYPDDVLIIFKHFPLGAACNPSMNGQDMQPQACAAAWAAEAAHEQEKFWGFHDLLFETDLNAEDGDLLEIAAKLELDFDAFNEARQSERVQARISAGIDLGTELGIPGTPAVFINGRLLGEFDENVLLNVIQRLLQNIEENADPA